MLLCIAAMALMGCPEDDPTNDDDTTDMGMMDGSDSDPEMSDSDMRRDPDSGDPDIGTPDANPDMAETCEPPANVGLRPTNGLVGAVHEMIFFQGVLTADEQAAVKAYLEVKWGL